MYPYTADLMCLDACRPVNPTPLPAIATVSTPLVIPAWEDALKPHPDRVFAQYISAAFGSDLTARTTFGQYGVRPAPPRGDR